MNGNRNVALQETRAQAFDTLAHAMHTRLPRRRAVGMLVAAIATGLLGISGITEPVNARKKPGKRRVNRYANAAETRRGIPPNCILVCCDGTCDKWKMCMKCVEWPKPTTSGVLAR
jgi:hypothetical protein